MDYKKKYKEALELMKDCIPDKDGLVHIRPCEIFPELKKSEDEMIRKAIIKMVSDIAGGFPFEKYGIQKKEALAWLEKQGKQKPTDKVEQKFKVGDWVVWNEHIICHIDNIYEENTLMYTINTNGVTWTDSVKKFDAIAHLWTIKDAKDGDVLADGYGIYIFEKFNECDKDCFVCNGAYQYSEKAYECGHMLCSTDVHPATKAERDLLFQKMEKAGYEWDDEKKELKKIEQKPAWSEEDEHILEAIIKEIEANKTAGPEYDEKVYDMFLSWLKSLKERYTWRPSDEQMKVLAEALSLAKNCGEESAFDLRTLYEQLKKLKEE